MFSSKPKDETPESTVALLDHMVDTASTSQLSQESILCDHCEERRLKKLQRKQRCKCSAKCCLKALGWTILGLVLFFLVFHWLIGALCMVYLPRSPFFPYNVHPEDVGITRYTNDRVVTVRNPQTNSPITIAIRYYPGANETYTVQPIRPEVKLNLTNNGHCVIVAHGHGSNMAYITRAGELSMLHKVINPLVAAGFNVLAFDQRMHGNSSYKPPMATGRMESLDVWALSHWLHVRRAELCPSGRIGLWGESMGGAAVLTAAAHENEGSVVSAILAESSYSSGARSLPDYLHAHFSWLPDWWITTYMWHQNLVSPLNIYTDYEVGWDSGNITQPVFVVYGEADDQVIPKESQDLVDHLMARPNGAALTEVWSHPYGHVRAYEDPAYHAKIVDWFQRRI